MKKLIILIVIILFLMSGCTISVTFGGFGNDTSYDLTDQELSPEIIGFDGRLAVENILTDDSSVVKTGFYIDGQLEEKRNDLGFLQDSLIIGDTLYLAFDGKGVVNLDLNNPDFDELDGNIDKDYFAQIMKLVTDGTDVYFIDNNKVCRIDKEQKKTCSSFEENGNGTEVLELYKGNLYVSIDDRTGNTAHSKVLKISPKTLKVSSTSTLDFAVNTSAVVGDTLYIDTGESFGVYEKGKLNLYNLNNYFYQPGAEPVSIYKLKTVGDKLLVATGDAQIFSIDPKQNHKVTEVSTGGDIMSVNGTEAYISDQSSEGEKNILKYDSKTDKAEYIDNVEEIGSNMYLYY